MNGDRPGPEPGWYDDPHAPGHQRWWDGAAWGPQTRPIMPPGAPADRGSKTPGWLVVAAVVLVVLLAITAGGSSEPPPVERAPTATETEDDEDRGDLSAQWACQHFRNVARDMTDGMLTEFELRQKLREVMAEARGSDDRRFGARAEDMVAGLTSGDEGRFDQGLRGFDRACDSIGQ